jgi:hypothetical protein
LGPGIESPSGKLAMPGFAGILTDDEIWALIDTIHARNAGLAFEQSSAWLQPTAAPDLQADCADGPRRLADFHGHFVRLAIGPAPAGPNPPGVTTILVAPLPDVLPGPDLCLAHDAAVAPAYAMVAGLPASAVPATQFLIDGNGFLRAIHHPGFAPHDWNDPAVLAAKIKELGAPPAGAVVGMEHMHRPM